MSELRIAMQVTKFKLILAKFTLVMVEVNKSKRTIKIGK